MYVGHYAFQIIKVENRYSQKKIRKKSRYLMYVYSQLCVH